MKVTTASWNEQVARQFPCIASTCKVEYLTERAKVAVLDATLLETMPSEEEGTDASGYSTTDRIEFWDLTHEPIGHAVRASLSSNEPRNDHDGETVGDALAAIGPDAQNVRFITRFRAVDAGCVGNDTDSRGITVYRVADFDLTGWLAARAEAARVAVDAGSLIPTRHGIYDSRGHRQEFWSSEGATLTHVSSGDAWSPDSFEEFFPGGVDDAEKALNALVLLPGSWAYVTKRHEHGHAIPIVRDGVPVSIYRVAADLTPSR